jgi:shikimate dehydrogenase
VIVAARRIEEARDLINVISGSSNRQIVNSRAIRRDQLSAILLESDSIREHLDRFSMMINTTPVGMSPHDSISPWPVDLPFPQGVFVYDLVYNPAETMLVQQARRADLQASNGLGMLVEQAALAFERWTKVAAPRQMMRQAVQEDGG